MTKYDFGVARYALIRIARSSNRENFKRLVMSVVEEINQLEELWKNGEDTGESTHNRKPN